MASQIGKSDRKFGQDPTCETYPLTITERAEQLRSSIINNKKVLVVFANVIGKKLKRPQNALTSEEMDFMINRLRDLDYLKIVQLKFPEIVEYVTDVISNKIQTYTCSSSASLTDKIEFNTYNIKEEQYVDLKKTVTGVCGMSPIGIENEYYQKEILHFDSRYKIRNPFATSEFKFSVSSTGGQSLGRVRTLNEVTNIRSMKIFPFNIPYNKNADSIFHEIRLVVYELTAQSIRTYDTQDFHFLFTTMIAGDRIILTPVISEYTFPRVVYQLTDVTLIFRNQNTQIIFDAGEIINATFDGTVPGIFSVTNLETDGITPKAHNLSTGNLVNFTNFKIGGTATAQLDTLCRQQGYFVTVVDAFTFTINCDMSSSPPPYDAGWDIILTSKQFIANIEFMYVRSKLEGRISGEDCDTN